MSVSSAGRVLIADDDAQNVQSLTQLSRRAGYEVLSVRDGQEALDSVLRDRPDVVLLDVNMPKLDGLTVCRRIKSDPATRLVPVILVSGLSGPDDRVRGIDAGADDVIAKPFSSAELTARIGAAMRLKRYTDQLDPGEAVLLSLARTIEARDPHTHGHCERLAHYASALGRRLGLSDQECRTLYRGGFLHDMGKIGIPDAVLFKPGPLTPAEYALMQRHTIIGDMLCQELRSLGDVRPIVRSHHERLDGSGYPDGLKGDYIPLLAQIMSVVDGYDAMTTARAYKPALSSAEACERLRTEVARGWKSARLVEPFIALLESGLQAGSEVVGHAVADPRGLEKTGEPEPMEQITMVPLEHRVDTYVSWVRTLRGGRRPPVLSVDAGDPLGRLARELDLLSESVTRREAALLTLCDLASRIDRDIVVDDVLADIFKAFHHIIPYDRIGCAFLSDDGTRLVANWAQSDLGPLRLKPGFSQPIAGSSLEAILTTRQPRILNDLEGYRASRPRSISTRCIVDEGGRSSLTCPLVCHDRPTGFLFFTSRQRETYSDVHQAIFRQISHLVAAAIDKARYYEGLVVHDGEANVS
jgi:putative two-component system response regulator